MSEEAVFVAIGIACVVAVLLFIVFIIYCVKKQQDKEQDRQMRHRRAREQRHRRHLMRANIVRPPPYDPNRRNEVPISQAEIPVTPPPEYKEVATPMPTHRNHIGLGDAAYTSYNGHRSQPASTGDISGYATTLLVGASYNNNSYTTDNRSNNDNNNNSYTTGSSSDTASNNNRNYINRNTMTTTRNGQTSNNTAQVQPHDVATDNREPMPRSPGIYSTSPEYSYDRNNRQVASVYVGQSSPHTATTQELSVAALLRQQNANLNVPVNTVSSGKPSESRSHNSYSRNDEHQQSSSNGYHNYNSFVGAGRNSNQTERKTAGEIQTGRSISSRYTPAVLTSRTLLDVNIVTVSPVQISNRGIQSRDSSTKWNTDHARKSDRASDLEELSLI